MPLFKIKIPIGNVGLEIEEEYTTQSNLMEKLSFYQALPTEGPTGNKDLKVTYRFIQNKYKYYSIRDEAAGQELSLGQYNDDSGSLFVKGWQPIFQGDNNIEVPGAQVSNGVSSHTPVEVPVAYTPTANPAVANPAVANPVAGVDGLSEKNKAALDELFATHNLNKGK